MAIGAEIFTNWYEHDTCQNRLAPQSLPTLLQASDLAAGARNANQANVIGRTRFSPHFACLLTPQRPPQHNIRHALLPLIQQLTGYPGMEDKMLLIFREPRIGMAGLPECRPESPHLATFCAAKQVDECRQNYTSP
jgi:hypothetical protein